MMDGVPGCGRDSRPRDARFQNIDQRHKSRAINVPASRSSSALNCVLPFPYGISFRVFSVFTLLLFPCQGHPASPQHLRGPLRLRYLPSHVTPAYAAHRRVTGYPSLIVIVESLNCESLNLSFRGSHPKIRGVATTYSEFVSCLPPTEYILALELKPLHSMNLRDSKHHTGALSSSSTS
ncbi:hypothetical protein BO71DRAFT_154253 [Aspergillus ellipticus CBS 707.79]|uniref:Uncharacterized protein n=1 Tax=Aspergillus ellipticus CBS 707.79 TaxID=1448320 RepID=A0A319EYI5_9EURO|nr:hypothetical protein BO71DRAFT_154253 [Aspergillus ellipticus CBS 707.79]